MVNFSAKLQVRLCVCVRRLPLHTPVTAATGASRSRTCMYVHAHALTWQDNTREEWKEHYIDYKALKKALKPLKGAKRKMMGGMVGGGGGEGSDSGGWVGPHTHTRACDAKSCV